MPISGWVTPASAIPVQRQNGMFLSRKTAERGQVLDMGNRFGYDACVFLEDTEITLLSDNEGLWMSDTPAEYYGMWELVARAVGPRVLVGGLGLGLLANLLALRRDVAEIVVVEISSALIKMIQPFLPDGVHVQHGDFMKAVLDYRNQGFDTVIADIIKNDESSRPVAEQCRVMLDEYMPDARRLYWLSQHRFDTETSMLFTDDSAVEIPAVGEKKP